MKTIKAMKLIPPEIKDLQSNLIGWKVVDNSRLKKKFQFETFMQAIVFINLVAEVSEKLNHHADIYISYNRVDIEIYTHKLDGLTKLDFVLAEKIDQL